MLEVIKAFGEVVGKQIPYVIAPRRKGDVDSLFASCDLAEKVGEYIYFVKNMLCNGVLIPGAGLEIFTNPD